jgi:hypothetical protein
MKKNSPKLTSMSLPMLREDDFLEDNRVTEWLLRNGKKLLWCIGGGLIALLLLSLWLFKGNTEISKNYYATISAFQQLEKASSPELQQAALKDMNLALAKSPNLHAKYDAPIAQLLLNAGKVEQAKPFAESALGRTDQDALPGYNAYAQISLLIAEGKHDEALKQSLMLKEALMSNETTSGSLFAFNLLRIAFLQGLAGTPSAEAASWKMWQEYASKAKDTTHSGPYAQIAALFSEGKLSLNDYIDAKLKALGPF